MKEFATKQDDGLISAIDEVFSNDLKSLGALTVDDSEQIMLSTHRAVYLSDEVVREEIEPIIRRIHYYNLEDCGIPQEDRSPILLFINSPGGENDWAWALIDTMLTSVTPVYTINMAYCYSAAAYIFLAGNKRFVNRHACFMFHRGEVEASMLGAGQLLDFADFFKESFEDVRRYVLERTRISESLYAQMVENDWYITAQQSLAFGVSHQYYSNIEELTHEKD